MTIIAIRNNIIAADSVVTNGDYILGHTEKLFEVTHPGKGFFGAAGYLSAVGELLQEFSRHGKLTEPYKDTEALWLQSDGTVICYEGGSVCSYSAPFYAIGSGSDLALAAMHAGADAELAVKIVCKMMPTECGGAIVSREVSGPDYNQRFRAVFPPISVKL